MIVTHDTSALKVRRFESWGEYCDYAAPQPKGSLRCLSRENNNGWDWTRTSSFEEALNLARFGWKEGREMIERLTAQLETVSGSYTMRATCQYDVTGDCVDVGRYLSGEPENMMFFQEEEHPTSGKVVSILFNQGASGAVNSGDMMKRGAAAAALADALENAGRSCEIVMGSSQRSGGFVFEQYIPLKKAGEALDMDTLAFALAHPSSYRRIAFSSWEQEDDGLRQQMGFVSGRGYGNPKECLHAEADIVIPQMFGTDSAALLKWVREQLIAQGITLEGEAVV